MEIKLTKPITVGDKKIEAITLNFDALTGADFLVCSREATRKGGEQIVYFELDDAFRLEVMGKASGLDPEIFPRLSIRDYSAIDRKVRSFLMGTDSEE